MPYMHKNANQNPMFYQGGSRRGRIGEVSSTEKFRFGAVDQKPDYDFALFSMLPDETVAHLELSSPTEGPARNALFVERRRDRQGKRFFLVYWPDRKVLAWWSPKQKNPRSGHAVAPVSPPAFFAATRAAGNGKNPVKKVTLEQVEKKQAKAVAFLRDVVGDSNKADEIESLTPQEYAERKKLTLENPNSKGKTQKAKGKRNPDETAQAGELFKDFHGKDPTQILTVQTDEIGRDTYTALGELWEMKLNAGGEKYGLKFEGCKVKLCASADGKQLYCVGGDQDCSDCLPTDAPDKDFVSLGVLQKISYVTRKAFDKFQESAYEHKFGEEGGEPPWAFYARQQKRIFIVDGTYRVEAPGIID
jgi:hypothetical protein